MADATYSRRTSSQMLRPIDEANERLHVGGSVDPSSLSIGASRPSTMTSAGRCPCLHARNLLPLAVPEHPRGCRESDLLGNRVDLHVDPAVHRPVRGVVPIAQYDGRALSRNVGVYRDIFHRMRYTPAPMIDFIDGDEQSDFLRQEEVCGLDIARQDQRSWN